MSSYDFLRRSFTCSLLLSFAVVAFPKCISKSNDSLSWNTFNKKEYSIHYTAIDKNRLKYVDSCLQSGCNYIAGFFQHSFLNKFEVYIFPNRTLLDKQWQKDWNDSTFHSQCWMIASGVAHRLDLLSPNAWLKEAYEHNADDAQEIRQVIWHELTHVYHGQYNPDHTFSYVEKLDWLVEGVATYVSGQLNERRLQKIKQLVTEDKTPSTLDNFWKGQDKYGLSGSIVAFIDKKYGRNKLFGLLKQTSKEAVLKELGISESELLKDWKRSFQ